MWSVRSVSCQSRRLWTASQRSVELLTFAKHRTRTPAARGFTASSALFKKSSSRSAATNVATNQATSSAASIQAAATMAAEAPKPMSVPQKAVILYVLGALAAFGIIAKIKHEGEEPNELKVYNLARRKLAKDHRLFEIVGYPKEFQKIESSGMQGRFRVVGDAGQVVVAYNAVQDELFENSIRFDLLSVQTEEQSADGDVKANGDCTELYSVLTEADDPVKKEETNKSMSDLLSKKLVFPVLFGSLIGGFSGFYIIRILRNRPSYVHKLVLGRVNEHPMAVTLLGSPIKCNKKEFVGQLTYGEANYSIACNGPRGKGMLFVKATKYLDKNSVGAGMTAQSEWRFNTLTLSVPRNDLRSKDKQAKVLNLLKT